MTISAKNLSVQIGTAKLIESINMQLKAGEIIAVVGPNGAGKSTLLKALAGEIPYSGNITIHDCPMSQWNRRDLATMRAVLPQSSNLTFSFTVREVVSMGRTPHIRGAETQNDYDIVTEAMHLTLTSHLANRIYTTLSGGEKQRVQLARVLAQIWEEDTQRYLLLDEPTNNLDLSHQHRTLSLGREFAGQNVGVLTVLHDLNLAAQYADRILVMQNGQIVAEGTPHAVLTPAVIEQTFNLPAIVQEHPYHDCPLVIPLPQSQSYNNSAVIYKNLEEKIS